MNRANSPTKSVIGPRGCRLWIDGVGCWQLWFDETLTIGGGAAGQTCEADFGVQAALSRKHCLFQRVNEDYRLTALGPTTVNNEQVTESTFLPQSADITLDSTVQIGWSIPSVLSRTAVLRINSSHRSVNSVDGVVMVADNLLLGAGPGVHISCPQWTQPLVLFRRRGHLYCQPQAELKVDDEPISEARSLTHGSIISIGERCARLEVPD